MKRSTCLLTFSLLFIFSLAQQTKKGKYGDGPDGVAAVGVIKGLSDEQLLETVQKQTFRFFWHGAHPVSGLALERSNIVLAEHYWDWVHGLHKILWSSWRSVPSCFLP